MVNRFTYTQWALAVTLLLTAVTANAQILSPTVLSTSGAFYSSANNSLSVTIGEMTMVEPFTTSSVILTQGFQQPQDENVGIISVSEPDWSIDAYPNPTAGNVTVQVKADNTSDINLSLFDVTGQLVTNYGAIENNTGTQLNLSELAAGVYVLRFSTSSQSKNIRLVKN